MHPFGQMEKFCEQFRGLNNKHLQILFGGFFVDLRDAVISGKLPDREAFHEFLGLGKLKIRPNIVELPRGIIIPEGATIASLKSECQYDFDSDFAKKYLTDEYFKVTKFGPRQLYLAWFDDDVTTEYVINIIGEMKDYEMALVEDLLAFSAFGQSWQRYYQIVALGSSLVVDDCPKVPCLDGNGNHCTLRLRQRFSQWAGNACRFLLVDKNVSLTA